MTQFSSNIPVLDCLKFCLSYQDCVQQHETGSISTLFRGLLPFNQMLESEVTSNSA